MCSGSAKVSSSLTVCGRCGRRRRRNVTADSGPATLPVPGGFRLRAARCQARLGVWRRGGLRYTPLSMSRICQVTGRKPSFGNNVSHSHRKTRRRWNVNVQRHRYWVPSEKRWVTLRVSAKGMKTINRHGIEKVLADMRRRGVKV